MDGHSPSTEANTPATVVTVVGSEAVTTLIRQRLEGVDSVSVGACPDGPGLPAAIAQRPPTTLVLPAGPGARDFRAVLSQLQADPSTAELPVIVLGGTGHPGERRRAFAAGAADHWQELPERTELLARLQQMARVAQLTRERDAARAEVESLRRQFAHAGQSPGQVDPETALPARSRLEEVLDAEWRRARRSGSWMSLVVIEVGSGERAPSAPERQRLAAGLRAVLRRGGDLLARCDDRRFVALLPEVGDDGATTVTRALVRAARASCPGQPLAVGSASVRPRDSAGGSPVALLAEAGAGLRPAAD